MNKYVNKIKYVIAIILILAIGIPFINLSSIQSVDDSAYLIALGIDAGTTDTYEVTFEFTMPSASGEGSSSEESNTIENSVQAPSLDSAISLMNVYISKEINLSHCKAVIISETLASNGISEVIHSLLNKVQIRPDTNIIISKCLAKDFVKNTELSLENLIGKYYETLPVSSNYTGYISNVLLSDFFNKLSSNTCEPIAMLGGLNLNNNNQSSKGSYNSSLSANANSSPIENSGTSSLMGICVFKGDTLVGELSSEETLAHMLVTNKVDSCTISIPHPYDENLVIDLFLYNKSKPKITVDIVNGSPFIQIDMKLEAKVSSFDSTSNFSDEELINQISESSNNYIQNLILNYLYKMSKEYCVDIDNFGKYCLNNFIEVEDFANYNWKDHFKDSFFQLNINTNILSSFLLTGI